MKTKEQIESESAPNDTMTQKLKEKNDTKEREKDIIQKAVQKKEQYKERCEDIISGKLEIQLVNLEKELDEYKNKYIRSQAEIENLRKRMERDVANAIRYGVEQLIVDLLPVVDSLVHGLENHKSTDPHTKSLREGTKLTLSLLHKMLKHHGVEIIDPKLGDLFNPDIHEAIAVQDISDAESNTIAQMIQKGYQLNGRVLRAARVIVST
nr:adenine nucleotide exchange factor of DnaK [Coxiella endosymbiont of Amblyomma americanum]